MPEPMISVYDDVLADPLGYRALALASTFGDVTIDNVTFHGIAPAPTTELLEWLAGRFADVADPVTTFLRLSPQGQIEPNFIHTDRDMGQWTAILYLNPAPVAGDGTTFWIHQPTGQTVSQTTDQSEQVTEWLDWRDLALWKPWRTVAAAFNRLVLFPAGCFHSRALPDSYGQTPQEARLIQVLFGGMPCR